MHQLAITQGAQVLSFARNAKNIPMPDGSTVWGPLKALPHVQGDYTIREVVVDGPQPGPAEIGGTEPPAVDGDVVKILRTVQAASPEVAAAHQAALRAEALAAIRAECQRRLAAGFDYDFGDGRGVHTIGTTERDMAGWDEVTMLAQAMLNAGDTEGTIAIATDSGICAVTAMEWNAILLAAAAFRQPIWQASFLLQAMDPVPADYADDAYWPD